MRTWRMEKTAGWGKQQGEETAAQIRRQRYGSSEKSIAAVPDDRRGHDARCKSVMKYVSWVRRL